MRAQMILSDRETGGGVKAWGRGVWLVYKQKVE